MMVNLRYLIPIAAFYVPGVMMLIGALVLGYSVSEVRDTISFAGTSVGLPTAAWVAIGIKGKPPIWLNLTRSE